MIRAAPARRAAQMPSNPSIRSGGGGAAAREGLGSRRAVFFAPFRLDVTNGRLWRGASELAMRPKTLAVLCYLLEHAGRLIPTREIVDAVWAGSHGSEALVKGCIREIRQALGDEAIASRYVETVGRRGYRFVALAVDSAAPAAPLDGEGGRAAFVGRSRELAELQARLAEALLGTRRIVLVSGEPGIGKTTLIERFLADAEARHDLRVARGRCVEHYGPVEPYLPVFEALTQLAKAPGGERIVGALGRHAPTWLAQMASLLPQEEREGLERTVVGTTRERMLREMCEAAEALAAERPLALWLEDLQWADPSTIDLIASVAARTEPARMLVLGTYRPADVVVSQHPMRELARQLGARGRSQELALRPLSGADVDRYVALRFPTHALPSALGPTLLEVTDGNPLFLAVLLDELVARGTLVARDGRWRLEGGLDAIAETEPESLRELIEQQVARLTEADERLLEAASVAGREFSAGHVAAALGLAADAVDDRLEAVSAHGRLVVARGIDANPGRPVTGRWAFAHALYQKFLYTRVSPSRRVRLHRRLGEALEAACGERLGDVAGELALHFERGHDADRAARHLARAGANALARSAYAEAIDLFSRALDALARLPAGRARDDRELDLRIAIGPPLMIVRGYAAPEVDRVYRRAAVLCRRLGPSRRVFATLCGLWRFHYTRGDLRRAAYLARRALEVAGRSAERGLAPIAHTALGCTLLYLGSFETARAHLQRGLAAGSVRQRYPGLLAHDPEVTCLAYLGVVRWFLGHPDQALAASRRSLALARELADPFSLSYALTMACMVPVARAEVQETLALSARAREAVADDRFPGLAGWSAFLQGWARGEAGDFDGGLVRMRVALTMLDRAGARTSKTFLYTLLAGVCARAGRPDEGLAALREGLALGRVTGERFLEAEMLRRTAELELLLAAEGPRRKAALLTGRAERRLRAALRLARRQRARSLELRAATSLARVLRRRGAGAAGRRLLDRAHAWFREGFDSRDLCEARALLDEMAASA
jgi:DNA-binding winged helix-turn-helix (wHTH) protein/tetratricopeptide (TPR) repeat protein